MKQSAEGGAGCIGLVPGHGKEFGLYPTSSDWEYSMGRRFSWLKLSVIFMMLVLASIPSADSLSPCPKGFQGFRHPHTCTQADRLETGLGGPADEGQACNLMALREKPRPWSAKTGLMTQWVGGHMTCT